MEFTYTYVGYFTEHLLLALPLLGFIALLITALGVIVGVSETWKPFDAIYWAFITATTVGYGDVRPKNRFSKCVSVLNGACRCDLYRHHRSACHQCGNAIL
jgi:voltage-gated potassium channel